jgi:uncharacterized protein YjiS (DUF1127 family)
MNLLRTIMHTLTQYRAFRAVLAELQSYSDCELRELALTRADIVRVAYEVAERRAAAHTPRRSDAPPAPVTAAAA